MKKLQIITFATFLVACFTVADAQTNSASSAPISNPAFNNEAGKFNRAIVKVNKAGFRVVKHFTTHFKDGDDVKWFVGENLIKASFNRDEVSNCVVYNKQGRWIRNINSYYEDKMDRDIREWVKRSEYFDDEITFVQEIQEGEILFYVVHLENENEYKQITVYDGEIKLFKKFDKQQ